MAKFTPQFVVTGNLTDDGSVTYLKLDRGWTPRLDEAAVVESEGVGQELLQAARAEERQVCDPYLMKVRALGAVIEPLSARERIRAEGPTTRLRRPDPTL
ncbi:MAG: DUF2849 domain-containing protein [Myxococcales bacterium]|nr:DUF2849 domain-containing protein [Myxococcales bacterium]